MQDKSIKKSFIKQNILLVLGDKGISKQKCYKATGICRGILDQNSGMTEDNIIRFLSHFEDVNANWLILGKQAMYLNENISLNEKKDLEEKINDLKYTIKVQQELIEQLRIKNRQEQFSL